MACRNLCERTGYRKPPVSNKLGVSHYEQGWRYCSRCERYFDSGSRCQCCHYLFRLRPYRNRNRAAKEPAPLIVVYQT